jgi:hypothetical protein
MRKNGDIYLYLDRDQCNRFEVPYFDKGALQIGADVLLRSKDYDTFHRGVLELFGFAGISLSRQEKDHPGWYQLNGYSIDDDGNVTHANA